LLFNLVGKLLKNSKLNGTMKYMKLLQKNVDFIDPIDIVKYMKIL